MPFVKYFTMLGILFHFSIQGASKEKSTKKKDPADVSSMSYFHLLNEQTLSCEV